MKVIVVGGGKIGFYLTQTLLEHGHQAGAHRKGSRCLPAGCQQP